MSNNSIIAKVEELKEMEALLEETKAHQILSGIKAWYKPEEMVGKHVMVLVNLQPKEIAVWERELSHMMKC